MIAAKLRYEYKERKKEFNNIIIMLLEKEADRTRLFDLMQEKKPNGRFIKISLFSFYTIHFLFFAILYRNH